jgi:hypothetical protein
VAKFFLLAVDKAFFGPVILLKSQGKKRAKKNSVDKWIRGLKFSGFCGLPKSLQGKHLGCFSTFPGGLLSLLLFIYIM